MTPRSFHPFVLSSLLLSVAPFMLHWRLNRDFRLVRSSKSDSCLQIFYWTIRALWWRQPLPLDFDSWKVDASLPSSVCAREWEELAQAWPFLEPFFASH